MNIFVSHLNFATSREGLQDLFKKFGEVKSVKIIYDRFTGRSRGFGFVEMANDIEGQNAIAHLDQSDFEGMTINVNIAREKRERKNNNYDSRY